MNSRDMSEMVGQYGDVDLVLWRLKDKRSQEIIGAIMDRHLYLVKPYILNELQTMERPCMHIILMFLHLLMLEFQLR